MIGRSDSVDRGFDLVEESELKMPYEVGKRKEMSNTIDGSTPDVAKAREYRNPQAISEGLPFAVFEIKICWTFDSGNLEELLKC